MKKLNQPILLAVLFCLFTNCLLAQYVFDYMKVKPGMHDEYLKLEKAWKKIHQARINDGKMIGWGLVAKQLPWGSTEAYYDGTVDLYADWEQFMQSQTADFTADFGKVHPGKDAGKLFAETEAACDLIRQEVRVIVDNSKMPDGPTTNK